MPHPWSGRPVPLSRPTRHGYFNDCVTEAVAAITQIRPHAFDGIVVGVEEVPYLRNDWSGRRVPMSAALEPSRGHQAQIVIYERPLEHRASSRSQLRRLVHRTIVEQLSVLTGTPVEELLGHPLEDWDD